MRSLATTLIHLSLITPLTGVLACGELAEGTRPPPPGHSSGEGEGEQPREGEGEGPGGPAGEGEGEEVPGGDIDIDASGITTDRDRAPADGASFVVVTVSLAGHDGAPIVGRAVTIVASGGDVSFEQPAPTDADGRTTTLIRAAAPAEVQIGAAMPDHGSTASLASVTVTFDPCLSIEDTLVNELWGPLFSRCVGCHNEYGLPLTAEWNNRHILKFPGEPEFAEHNVDVLRMLAVEDGDGTPGVSLLVAMPTNRFSHSGGEVIPQGSTEEALLIAFSERLRAGTDSCGPGAAVRAESVLANVGLVSRRETLARAKLALIGTPLDAAELALPLADDEELAAAIDAIIESPQASDRIVEIYADWLWTDRWTREAIRSTGGANILTNRLAFPLHRTFQPQGTRNADCKPDDVCCGDADSTYPGSCTQPEASDNASDSLAREPLELIRYVWNTGLRADAIANADFTVANPYTATLYGFAPGDSEWTFNNNNTPTDDRREYRPLVLRDTAANTLTPQPGVGNRYPHAGILTSHATLLRFPSTTSNRERRRAARVVYERFLAIDVMKLADFSTAGLAADADLDTAPRTELACTACHSVMDPVARTLFSFDEDSLYQPNRARPSAAETFEAGFMGERFCSAGDDFCSGAVLGNAADERAHVGDPVTWLAERVVQSPRFPYAMTLPLFTGLTGATVLAPASDLAGDRFAEKNLAFAIQTAYLQDLAERFDTVLDRNLKALAKEIFMGPFFRGGDHPGEAEGLDAHALALAGVGRGTLITPEQLSRKLLAVTGERVTAPANTGTADLLRDFDEYRVLFGGVNWDSLTVRFREPNPVMMRIVERAANQVGCRVIPEDFAMKNGADRRLLAAGLTTSNVSEDRVRDEIVLLRLKLLGEELPSSHEEITLLYELFATARAAAAADVENLPVACQVTADTAHNALSADADGTLRGWIAVTTALLSDPLFVVE